jgi:hypothetical protein
MRLLSAAGLLIFTACATQTHAAEANAVGCDAMVGVWKYVPPSAPGHAIIAKQADKYLGIFVNTLPEPYSEHAKPRDAQPKDEPQPDSYSVAGVWEYTCEAAPDKLRLTLRWLYSSYRPQDVGTQVVLEVEIAGPDARWWYLGPDGKRGSMGAGHLLK